MIHYGTIDPTDTIDPIDSIDSPDPIDPSATSMHFKFVSGRTRYRSLWEAKTINVPTSYPYIEFTYVALFFIS